MCVCVCVCVCVGGGGGGVHKQKDHFFLEHLYYDVVSSVIP